MKNLILTTIQFTKPFLILILGLSILLIISLLIVIGGIYWEINSWPIIVSIFAGTFLFCTLYFSFNSFKYPLKSINQNPKISFSALLISYILIFVFIHITTKYLLNLIS